MKTCVCAALCAFSMLLSASSFAAETLDAEEAGALVRARWFEGIPAEAILPLTPEAVAQLDSLLRDTAEVEVHAACLEVLGRAGGSGAFEAVANYAAQEPQGEVSGAVYRARMALPLAWGALARHDVRALAPLLDLAREGSPAATWRHPRLGGERIRQLERRMARTGLQLSGRRSVEIDALLSVGGEGAR